MSIDLTRDELERLILLVSRTIMDKPDAHLDSVADKLMVALFGNERAEPTVRDIDGPDAD